MDSQVLLAASTKMLEAAISETKLAGFSRVLEVAAASIDADGCVLWTRDDYLPARNKPDDPFAPLAQWWKSRQYYSHDGMSHASLAGRATGTGKLQHIGEIRDADPSLYDGVFVARTGTRVICSIPLKIEETRDAALNFYRQRPGPFSSDELELAAHLARYIPPIFQSLLQRVTLPLLKNTETVLSRWTHDGSTMPAQWPNHHLKGCCEHVREVFNCVEVSVFLRDPRDEDEAFVLAASTWPWDTSELRSSYRPQDEHLTSSVLRSKAPILVRDLGDFDRDPERMTRLHPGVRWSDPFRLKERAQEIFSLKGDERPPLSYVAAPIVSQLGEMLGVIRCSTAKTVPYYFVPQQLDLLTLVASQIGRCWRSWLTARDLAVETSVWKRLTDTMRKLSSRPLGMISWKNVSVEELLNSCLEAAAALIPHAENLDVRLFDRKANELFVATQFGPAWDDETRHRIPNPRLRRFPTSVPSIGARVFRSRQGELLADVSSDPDYSETFVDCQSLICVPIIALDRVLGVLDIRSHKPHRLHGDHLRSATVIANHIALYVHLKRTVDKLAAAQINMSNLQRQQADTHRDLAHQLRTPISVAFGRAVKAAMFGLVRKNELPDSDRVALERHLKSLTQLKALLARAVRVTESTDLYSALAAGRTPPGRKETIAPEHLLGRVIGLAADAEIEIGQRLRFEIDRSSFAGGTIAVNMRMFEQAIFNVIENAAKYGFPGTVVHVGWRAEAQRAYLHVTSVGLPMSPSDIQDCVKRYWRSEEARLTRGTGSGIGLWMVERIMKAHSGTLEIVTGGPAGSNPNQTEVRLCLPAT